MQRVRFTSHRSPVHKLGESQMSLSPKFRLSPAPSSSSPESAAAAAAEADHVLDPLIPGLPDDLALNCLLRLPVSTHGSCRAVCRRWGTLLNSKASFFSHRRLLGICSPWLFVFSFHRCTGKLVWQVLDLIHHSWHTIPSMPCRGRACPHGFACVAIPPANNTLLVCGGLISDINCPLHLVLKYEVHQNQWTVMNRMITPRSFFAAGVINNTVYVAGGFSSDEFELDSAEAFDSGKGEWRRIASMGANLSSYDSAVLDGKLLVTEGWAWPFLFSPRGQVYDPKRDSWESMAAGLREGWTGASVVVEGHLLVISEHERMKVKFYVAETDSWDSVEGSPLPEKIKKPICVSSSGSRMFAVGRGLHVAVGYVKKTNFINGNNEMKQAFSIQWQVIEAPREFCDFTPTSTQVLFA